MSNSDIRKLWEEFVNDPKYSKYFLSNEEEWKITLTRIKRRDYHPLFSTHIKIVIDLEHKL